MSEWGYFGAKGTFGPTGEITGPEESGGLVETESGLSEGRTETEKGLFTLPPEGGREGGRRAALCCRRRRRRRHRAVTLIILWDMTG